VPHPNVSHDLNPGTTMTRSTPRPPRSTPAAAPVRPIPVRDLAQISGGGGTPPPITARIIENW
jgi:hypothetical protein